MRPSTNGSAPEAGAPPAAYVRPSYFPWADLLQCSPDSALAECGYDAVGSHSPMPTLRTAYVFVLALILALSASATHAGTTPTPTVTPMACCGDCDGDRPAVVGRTPTVGRDTAGGLRSPICSSPQEDQLLLRRRRRRRRRRPECRWRPGRNALLDRRRRRCRLFSHSNPPES